MEVDQPADMDPAIGHPLPVTSLPSHVNSETLGYTSERSSTHQTFGATESPTIASSHAEGVPATPHIAASHATSHHATSQHAALASHPAVSHAAALEAPHTGVPTTSNTFGGGLNVLTVCSLADSSLPNSVIKNCDSVDRMESAQMAVADEITSVNVISESNVNSERMETADNSIQSQHFPETLKADDDQGEMSDATLPADVTDDVANEEDYVLPSGLKNEHSSDDEEWEPPQKPKTKTKVKVKTRKKPRAKVAENKTQKKRGPKPGSKRKPSTQPKSQRVQPPRPKSTLDKSKTYSTTICLGQYRRIKVSIELSGVEGAFSRVNGEVVYTIPVAEDDLSRNQWKLTDILREVEMAAAPVQNDFEDDDPYGPLWNDLYPPSSPEMPPAKSPRKSTKTRDYECLECSETFKRKAELTTHHRSGMCGAVSGPYLCDECGVTINTSAELKRHRKQHNKALCHLCGKTFAVGHCMKQHMITHAGYKPFECEICGSQFRSKTAKILHESTHKDERPHICQMCAASFKRIGLLKRHIKFVHNQEAKNIRCKTCDRGFRSKSDLNAHMPSHTGEKRYCCDQCGKRFAYKVCLSDHVKTVHSDIRNYKCAECDKAFKTSSMLASHRRSHAKQASGYSSQPAPKPPKQPSLNHHHNTSATPSNHHNHHHHSIANMADPIATTNNEFIVHAAHQRPISTQNASDFSQYSQRYIPQVGDYSAAMAQNPVFSPLRYLDLTATQQVQKTHVSQIYRDAM